MEKPIVDYLLEVLVADTLQIQEGHWPPSHLLCGLIENAIFKASA